jgi:hypothetical protein
MKEEKVGRAELREGVHFINILQAASLQIVLH